MMMLMFLLLPLLIISLNIPVIEKTLLDVNSHSTPLYYSLKKFLNVFVVKKKVTDTALFVCCCSYYYFK